MYKYVCTNIGYLEQVDYTLENRNLKILRLKLIYFRF